MRIAITGGRGLLGRAVTAAAVAGGHEVLAIDHPDASGRAGHERSPGVMDATADVTSFEELCLVVRGCDAMVHLAAFTSPHGRPGDVVHNNNVTASYNALSVSATVGIRRVCLASSVNAVGGAYSRHPRYETFPVDETHPCYAEDPYSLSKWILEAQASAFARRYEDMTITSLRFHALVDEIDRRRALADLDPEKSCRDLWGYSPLGASARACLDCLTAPYTGHEVLYVVAENTALDVPSLELARRYYPDVPVVGDLSGHRSFFDSSKAARLIGWAPGEGSTASTNGSVAALDGPGADDRSGRGHPPARVWSC